MPSWVSDAWLLQSRPKLLWKSLAYTTSIEENSVFLAYLPGQTKWVLAL